MPVYTTPDGRYTYAIETPNQGDGNSVVYDNQRGIPVWDRWTYEASLGEGAVAPSAPAPTPAGPAPHVPTPHTPDVPRSGVAKVIPVTRDGAYVPRMYSYWSNAWINGSSALVFAGHVDGSARLFSVRLDGQGVAGVAVDLPAGTTEGWYWDASGGLYLTDGPRLRRIDVRGHDDRVVFDISDEHPGCILWQAHSSDDGQTHSATVKRITSSGSYPAVGTVVFRRGHQEYFPAQGDLDESQIDKSGRWLVIKESEANRIIDLETRVTRTISDEDGAVGHSDCGDGFLVGEDNIHGACVLWDLRGPLVPSKRVPLFDTWGMGHVSVRGNTCLLSDEKYLSLVSLNGGGVVHLLEHGMTGNDYDHQVKANLDPTGRVACYMSNMGGAGFDVFLAVLPT